MTQTAKPVLTYVYDPLCGWCFGFSPNIQKLYNQYRNELDFEVISGGMVLDEREGPIGEVAAYIQDAYKQVELRTGVKFGEAFLKNILAEGSTWFSSLSPSKALAVVKRYAPKQVFPFSAELQKAIYQDGIDPNTPESYLPYIEAAEMDHSLFLEAMGDPETEDLTGQDFHFSRQLQVQGFPAVFVFLDQTYYLIARGYTQYDTLEQTLKRVLDNAKKSK